MIENQALEKSMRKLMNSKARNPKDDIKIVHFDGPMSKQTQPNPMTIIIGLTSFEIITWTCVINSLK